MFSVNDFYLDLLLDKPPATSRPLTVTRGDKVKPPHQLRQKFSHFEERDVLADASSCTGTKL